jgi:hypothetical protein
MVESRRFLCDESNKGRIRGQYPVLPEAAGDRITDAELARAAEAIKLAIRRSVL